jgi:hypothetical protein
MIAELSVERPASLLVNDKAQAKSEMLKKERTGM